MELVQSQCGSWFVYSFCKLCPRPRKTQYVEDSKRRVRNWKNWGLIENHSKKFASLIVNASSDGGAEVVVVEKPPKLQRFQVFDGSPTPFGATARDGGVNFAVYSSNALSATLCFMTLSDLHQKRVTEQISMDPMANRTGDVWHVFLKGDFEDMLYGYKFDGKFCPEGGHYYDSSQILLDPYAKAVVSRGDFGVLGPEDDCWPEMACMVPSANIEFDWEGDLPLKFPQRDLVIYEMHIRGYTRHDSSRTEFPGTYLGVVEKLDHLKELGVNCVELMPCHEFNELEHYCYNSVLDDYKVNFWGYSTINYFSPMIRYSSAGKRDCGSGAINEFKLLVKEAHKRGIEVIMDVVFNHTAEGNEKGPTLSFRGVDNSVFYMLAPKGEFYNYSGCGNTFNCNHPVVRQFILDCLRALPHSKVSQNNSFYPFKIGKSAYKIDPPAWMKIHPVFHVSFLEPYHADMEDPSRNVQTRETIMAKAKKRSVEAILADRMTTSSRKTFKEFLVKWRGLDDDEISWEKALDHFVAHLCIVVAL